MKVLPENTKEIESLREIVEERSFGSASTALKRRAEELKGRTNTYAPSWRSRTRTQRQDEKEDLVIRSRRSDWVSKRCNGVETQSPSNAAKVVLRS